MAEPERGGTGRAAPGELLPPVPGFPEVRAGSAAGRTSPHPGPREGRRPAVPGAVAVAHPPLSPEGEVRRRSGRSRPGSGGGSAASASAVARRVRVGSGASRTNPLSRPSHNIEDSTTTLRELPVVFPFPGPNGSRRRRASRSRCCRRPAAEANSGGRGRRQSRRAPGPPRLPPARSGSASATRADVRRKGSSIGGSLQS